MRRAIASVLACGIAAVCAGEAVAVMPGEPGRLAFSTFDHKVAFDTCQTSFVGDPSTGSVVQVGHGDHPRWSPAGDEIAFARSNCRGYLPSETSGIAVVKPDGTGTRQLTVSGDDAGFFDQLAAWSPDGTEVAFFRTHVSEGGGPYELRAVAAAGGPSRLIAGFATNPYAVSLDWSPRGDKIVLATNSGARVLDLTTGITSTVTGGFVSDARFLPDGDHLLVLVEGTARLVTLGGQELDSFAVSWDGSGIAPAPDGEWATAAKCDTFEGPCRLVSTQLRRPGDPPAPRATRIELTSGRKSHLRLDWESVANYVLITAGPSGLVRSDAARFEFSIPDEPEGGRYQCRIAELGGWGDCTSPHEVGGLPDGEHTFEVRFVGPGQEPESAPVTTRTWTSDTAAPSAVVDSAPPATTTANQATIAFHSTEPENASFRCRLDDEPERDCASPQTLTGLGVGAHAFAIWAVDAAGNVQGSPTVVTWTVEAAGGSGGGGGGGTGGGGGGAGGGGGGGGTGLPPVPPSAGCATGRVEAGPMIALARGGCFSRIDYAGEQVLATSGEAMVNGIAIRPRGGTKVLVDAKLGSGTVRTTGPVTLRFGAFDWDVSAPMRFPVTAAATTAKFALPAYEETMKLAGLKLTAAPIFEVSRENGGQTKVGLKLELPAALAAAPKGGAPVTSEAGGGNGVKGVGGEFAFTASNEAGVSFAGKMKIAEAWLFGKLQLKDVGVGIDSGPPLTFEGFGTLVTKAAPAGAVVGERKPEYTLAVSLGEGGAFGLLRKASIQASQFQKHLAYGVFLQRFGGEFAKGTFPQFSANAGVSFGPRLKLGTFFDGEAVSLDGKATLVIGDDIELEVQGDGKIVEAPVGSLKAKVATSGRAEASGYLDLSVGGYGIAGNLSDTWFDVKSRSFNAFADGKVRMFGIEAEAESVVSSVGVVGCFGPAGLRMGVARRWGGSFEAFSSSCDVGPFKVAAPGAALARAQAGVPVTVARGERLKVVRAVGAGAAPKLVLSGPGGATVSTPAGPESVRSGDHVVVQDHEARTTTIALLRPAAGTWTASVASGEPAAAIRVADPLPEVEVKASVRARGARRVLSWRAPKVAGHRIELVERGAAGEARTLKTVRGGRGTVTFTPSPWTNAKHSIVAVVTNDGLPRSSATVARFMAPALRVPAAVRGLSHRRGVLRWRRAAGAARYLVALRDGAGAITTVKTRRTQLRVARKGARKPLLVTVVGVAADGRAGRSATLTAKKLR